MLSSSLIQFMHHFFIKKSLDKALNYRQHMPSSYKIIEVQCRLNYLQSYRKDVNTSVDGHEIGLFYRLMRQAEELMESEKGINEQGIGCNQQQQVVSKSLTSGTVIMDSNQQSVNIYLQQADKEYEISKAHQHEYGACFQDVDWMQIKLNITYEQHHGMRDQHKNNTTHYQKLIQRTQILLDSIEWL
ncbi:MAG: hypothetical protein EZS28_039997 [Streblomastix strix]|uniref:Uncharacterized protein n=1 Tax=Streblomastix strix TaxID=222440 RepID=A0A5J4U1P1_9EUKA|nr:MAG: hypothetical protein EZS28_039997 [Streblomastix strix]